MVPLDKGHSTGGPFLYVVEVKLDPAHHAVDQIPKSDRLGLIELFMQRPEVIDGRIRER